MFNTDQQYTYRPHGVCSRSISFDLDDENKIHNLAFVGGCNGNLKGIGKLVEGMPADWVIDCCLGTECGGKPTSCPDQLAIALQKALIEKQR